MATLKNIILNVKPYLNKYIITIVVFGIFIVFIDENNVIKRVEYEIKIKGLHKEIRHYRELQDQSARKLKELHSSNEELERMAREDYLMKKPGEEIFIVE